MIRSAGANRNLPRNGSRETTPKGIYPEELCILSGYVTRHKKEFRPLAYGLVKNYPYFRIRIKDHDPHRPANPLSSFAIQIDCKFPIIISPYSVPL